jgi:phosphatidylglycerol:prolipoprotein diacylglycerol transferase
MNPILLKIGNITIYWYSIMILIGFLIASYLITKESKRFNIKKETITDMLFYTIVIGILGARLYYVIFNLNYYKYNLLDIFKVWEGGLAIHGGIIAGALFIIIYTKKNNLNTLKILDICVPGLLIGQALGRWGNFFNQEAHGPITLIEHLKYLPKFIQKGMYIDGNYYMPTFLYESILCLIGLIIILIIRRKLKIKNGQITGFYLIWYGIIRFIIESFRTDSLMLSVLKQAQIISIIMIIIGIILIIKGNKNEKYSEINNKK